MLTTFLSLNQHLSATSRAGTPLLVQRRSVHAQSRKGYQEVDGNDEQMMEANLGEVLSFRAI